MGLAPMWEFLHGACVAFKVEEQILSLRVLIVTTIATTIKAFLMPNVKMLQNLGFDVEVASNFSRDINDIDVIDFKEQLAGLSVGINQIDFTRSPLDITSHMKSYIQLKRLLKLRDYTFIHTNTPIASVLSRKAGHATGTSCIYTAHGFHFYNGAPLLNWMIWYPIEKHYSRYTDVLITINKEDYELAKKCFKAKKTTYIPGVGVDLSRFPAQCNREDKRKELGLCDKDFAILAVGELNNNKNHIVLVKALKELPNNVKLFIAGKGPLHDKLLSEANKLGVNDRLKLLGYRSDIPELMKACDLFCMPSLREGLPVSLIEAVASGCPSLASSIRGCSDVLGGLPFDFLVLDGSPEDWRNKIKILIEKEVSITEISNYLINKSREFSLQRVQDDYYQLYCEYSR